MGVSKRKLKCLASYGAKSVQLMFKTEMLIYQSKDNFDVNILFARITCVMF